MLQQSHAQSARENDRSLSATDEAQKLAIVCDALFYHKNAMRFYKRWIASEQDAIPSVVDDRDYISTLVGALYSEDDNLVFQALVKWAYEYAVTESDDKILYINASAPIIHWLTVLVFSFQAGIQFAPTWVLIDAIAAGLCPAVPVALLIVPPLVLFFTSAFTAGDLMMQKDCTGALMITITNTLLPIILIAAGGPSGVGLLVALTGVAMLATLMFYSHRKSQIKPKAEREQCSLGLFAQKHKIPVSDFQEVKKEVPLLSPSPAGGQTN